MDEVNEYIASFPPDVQPILLQVRDAILAACPDATPAIRYKIASFEIGEKRHVYFGGWKKHVGVYPVYALSEPLEGEVAPYRSGADTLKFMYAKPLPRALITRVVEAMRDR